MGPFVFMSHPPSVVLRVRDPEIHKLLQDTSILNFRTIYELEKVGIVPRTYGLHPFLSFHRAFLFSSKNLWNNMAQQCTQISAQCFPWIPQRSIRFTWLYFWYLHFYHLASSSNLKHLQAFCFSLRSNFHPWEFRINNKAIQENAVPKCSVDWGISTDGRSGANPIRFRGKRPPTILTTEYIDLGRYLRPGVGYLSLP